MERTPPADRSLAQLAPPLGLVAGAAIGVLLGALDVLHLVVGFIGGAAIGLVVGAIVGLLFKKR